MQRAFSLVTIACIVVSTPMAQTPNALTAAEKTAGWRLLFDGKTTAGWHVFGGGAVTGWDVSDGALIALGQGGGHDIVTNDGSALPSASTWNGSQTSAEPAGIGAAVDSRMVSICDWLRPSFFSSSSAAVADT